MRSSFVVGVTAAAVLFKVSTARGECGGALSAVLGGNTAAVDAQARFND